MTPNGSGVGAFSVMQCANKPCLQPAAISQSEDDSAITINTITIKRADFEKFPSRKRTRPRLALGLTPPTLIYSYLLFRAAIASGYTSDAPIWLPSGRKSGWLCLIRQTAKRLSSFISSNESGQTGRERRDTQGSGLPTTWAV